MGFGEVASPGATLELRADKSENLHSTRQEVKRYILATDNKILAVPFSFRPEAFAIWGGFDAHPSPKETGIFQSNKISVWPPGVYRGEEIGGTILSLIKASNLPIKNEQ